MSRHYADWIKAFQSYASVGEASPEMLFWIGVATIGGALRRKVWIDQGIFRWIPNFFIILVAPPGIIAKSTTSSLGMRLLRKVPGIYFGPDAVTAQSLPRELATATQGVTFPNGDILEMSAVSFESSELSTLLDPADKTMMGYLTDLWDGRASFAKRTKNSGNDNVKAPCINIIACTNPSWIAENFQESAIGGGFLSRCLLFYSDRKHKEVSYPKREIEKQWKTKALWDAEGEKLIEDLIRISEDFIGEVEITQEGETWGDQWYATHMKRLRNEIDEQTICGYLTRKQTQIHKVAIVLAANHQRTRFAITKADLMQADREVSALEENMPKVFRLIGRNAMTPYAEKLITFVRKRGGVEYGEAYRYVHGHFPDAKEFEGVLAGILRANYLELVQREGKTFLVEGRKLG